MHRLILQTGLLLLTASIGVTLKAQSTVDAKTLQGIQGLGVAIEDLDSDAEAAGLRGTDIQTDVELKLRLAGIKVLTLEDMVKAHNPAPWLYVNAQVVFGEPPSGLAAFAISCELRQLVVLSRDASTQTFVATWRSGMTGLGGRNTLKDSIRAYIKDQVDKFINAYLSVNPKK